MLRQWRCNIRLRRLSPSPKDAQRQRTVPVYVDHHDTIAACLLKRLAWLLTTMVPFGRNYKPAEKTLLADFL
jgi:hypothetical protein